MASRNWTGLRCRVTPTPEPGTTGVCAPTYHRAMGLGALPLAVARINYRLLRIPLHLLDDPGLRMLGGTGLRPLYTQLLIECDRTAAHLLADDTLRHRTAAARLTLARRRRRQKDEAIAYMRHRARFTPHRRRHHPHRPSPA